ncbi:MAG: carboxypeptidase-like regulatory domain-containing protein [Cytophagaceae bacterium]|nr:carboxypeptidase-like regulatory domain-containing protein [Cytophagaceae bacterium]
MNKFRLLLLFTLSFSFSFSFAQSGSIKGKIIEKAINEAAIGATVKIDGTPLAAVTGVDGDFSFSKVNPGIYKILISSIGFTPITIENVRVEADKSTIINAELVEDSKVLDALVVKGQRMTGTEVAVISELKQMQTIAVGVSSQQITKTQDRDASQVVRRVPGVSIFDERFIVIRGLNERYNTVLLNDIVTPSTEVDIKSFSFDLIPSTAIDRMLVFKSPSAELPGDIAGGAIKIFTKTVPDGNNLSVGFGLGYRTNTTGMKVQDHSGSGLDGIGFGSAFRSLPDGFPSTKKVINYASTSDIINEFKGLNNYYDLQTKNVNPDIRANINYSRRFFFGRKELTNFSYINYSNTHTNFDIKQNRFFYDGNVQNDFSDNSYSNNIRLGAMSNWALILNPKNKIEFRNLFNQLASKETVTRNGNLYENNLEIFNQSFRYEQKSIISSQLNGTHELSEISKLKWIGGFGYTVRNEPDFRRFTSSRVMGSNDDYKMDLQQFESPTLTQAARFYSSMDEFVITGTVNYDRIIKKNQDEQLNKVLKVGVYSEYKDRLFAARWFGIVNPNRITSELLSLSPEKFFNSENLSPTRVFYSEGTNNDDKYTAQNLLTAGYINFALPISEKFNLNLGLREEFNQQTLQSRERGGGAKIDVNNPIFSTLPSLNTFYKFNAKNILRFGFGSTVNRPEFRELAPFTYYDFAFDVSRRGNKNLKTASVQNLDLRYDFYPSETELITFGVFYKDFKNPIEASIFYNGSALAFTVSNAKSAYSTGVEMEIRKEINKNLMAVLNGSLIQSSVTVSGVSDQSRYLQGQSPYLVNAGLFYTLPKYGLQANALYNTVGKRIYVIGDNVLSSNVFEMPRHTIDLNLTKTLGKVEFKAGVQDLLNQTFRLIQDTNRDNNITDTDGIFQEYKRGSNYTISVNYKF